MFTGEFIETSLQKQLLQPGRRYLGYHYPEPRPLTNRERARLQSFPDNFKFTGSFAEVRRQIECCPATGVAEVAKALMPLFRGDYEKVDLNILYQNSEIRL